MRLFVILTLTAVLTLASGARLSAIKRRRESKWEIIHHEYHGPPAPLSKDGRVIDTPEVAMAKANHLAIHAETVSELARLMAEAEAAEARAKARKAKEEEEAAAAAAGAAGAAAGGEGGGGEGGESEAAVAEAPAEAAAIVAAEPEAPAEPAPIVVAEPVEMTPELMAMLMAAAADEPQVQQEVQAEAEAPASEAAPAAAAEPEAAALEAEAPAAAEEAAAPAEMAAGEAASEAPAAEAAAPAAEPEAVAAPVSEAAPAAEEAVAEVKEPAAEAPKVEEETKPVVEAEATNEVDADSPAEVMQRNYDGPLAPLGEDGRVLDTPEVRKAKEAHLIAYEQAVKLAKAKEAGGDGEVPAWYELRKRIYIPPVNLLYHHDGPIGYKGPTAPIGEDGRVKDTQDVERAKEEHRKAHEIAKSIAERNPPKEEDNLV